VICELVAPLVVYSLGFSAQAEEGLYVRARTVAITLGTPQGSGFTEFVWPDIGKSLRTVTPACLAAKGDSRIPAAKTVPRSKTGMLNHRRIGNPPYELDKMRIGSSILHSLRPVAFPWRQYRELQAELGDLRCQIGDDDGQEFRHHDESWQALRGTETVAGGQPLCGISDLIGMEHHFCHRSLSESFGQTLREIIINMEST